jgi:hypothetical protein
LALYAYDRRVGKKIIRSYLVIPGTFSFLFCKMPRSYTVCPMVTRYLVRIYWKCIIVVIAPR